MDAIVLENVTKSYDSVTAVNAVSLKVRAGAILGLLGPNGAGKTTTIRMIMNILVPDEGSIRVLGEPVRTARATRSVTCRRSAASTRG